MRDWETVGTQLERGTDGLGCIVVRVVGESWHVQEGQEFFF